MIIFLLLALQLTIAVFLFFICIAFVSGAPFVPSQSKTAKAMVEKAHITPKSIVYDLGSGDGRLLFLSAKAGAKKVIGIEINPILVIYTYIRILFSGKQQQISCRCNDFWRTNLTDADVVYVYLIPWKMGSLAKKLEKELKKDALIISNSFIFPNWKLVDEDTAHHVYVFRIPTKHPELGKGK